jgi:hypothetical protein
MAVLPFRSLFTLHVLSFSVFFNLGTFPTVSHVSSLAWNSQRKTGRRNKKDNKRYKSDSSMNATASLLLSSTAGHSDNSIFLNAACHCHDLCTAALQESDCRSVFVFHCFQMIPVCFLDSPWEVVGNRTVLQVVLDASQLDFTWEAAANDANAKQ